MRGRTLMLVALVATGISGCSPFEPRACTQIGCSSGFAVQLDGTPEEPFTVTVAAEGYSQSVTCQTADACALFFQATPVDVTVTFESAARTVTRSFTPEYRRTRPNGEGCPPECRVAEVVLEIDAG